MSTYILSACWKITGLTATQKLVLISLADQANDDGICWPSVETMCERTGISDRSVQSALNFLEKSKIVSRKIRPRKTTLYRINIHSCPEDISPEDISPEDISPEKYDELPRKIRQVTPKNLRPEPKENLKEPSLKDFGSPAAHSTTIGTRLPADWQSEAVEIGVEHLQVFCEAEKFRDYWHSVAGARGRKADWRATWRNWVRRAVEIKPPTRPSPTTPTPLPSSFAARHTDPSWRAGL